ncbi:hypothetical protein ACOSQ3_026867 [Xanthoceras sorbifolium]
MRCDIPELKDDNYKIWNERILLHLRWMDIDYAIRKDEPPAITDTSSITDITKISTGIRGSVDQQDNVRDLLKGINEQFVTSEKALASTLIMNAPQVQIGVEQPIIEVPQAIDNIPVDQVV